MGKRQAFTPGRMSLPYYQSIPPQCDTQSSTETVH